MSEIKPRVSALYRYPVKGFSGEKLKSVVLSPEQTFPADRKFAVENGPSGFDPAAPKWLSKSKFLCLMRNAKLAALRTQYNDRSGNFTASMNGMTLVEASLHTEAGRAAIEYALQEFMGGEARGPLKVLEAPGHSFSDVAAKVVHIINLGTIAELAEAAHKPLHPVRFRANLYLEDLKPWSEFDLIGKKIRAGGVTLKVTKRVERCAAVDVDPDTAQRDTELPQTIWRKTGDTDCGIYASVIEGGAINEGDRIEILD